MLLAGVATAAPSTVHKYPKPYSKGTTEMAGGRLLFGQTYTYGTNDGPLNVDILKAEYVPGRFSVSESDICNANTDHKLLLIYFRVKNAYNHDIYLGRGKWFQVVDANDNTIDDGGHQRRLSETSPLGEKIKPGQGIDDLVDCIPVPAQGPVTKLILQMGRAGTKDQVTRFDLGTAPNIIAPLPAAYANPSDRTGATLLPKIKATVGKTYQAGVLDMTVDSVSVEPGPIGQHTADSGKHFLVAKVTLTNRLLGQWYINDPVTTALETDDDKITVHQAVKADHDDDVQGRKADPDDTVSYRIIIPVPSDASLKTLTLVNDMGDNGKSSAFVYDVSSVK